jgi:CelD/BcsL family acetyltransferase involved in cellulose biosynthesis
MAPRMPPATLARAMRTVTHDDPSAFAGIADRWRTVLATDPAATVFHTPQYLATWWSEFGSRETLRMIEVLDGDRTIAIAPMTVGADGVARFAGDHDTTDYRGPTSAPEQRDAVAAAVFEAMGGDGARAFDLDGLAADSGWPDAFTDAAKAAGYSVGEEHPEACPRITIPGSYEAYLAALPGKLRHEIQRKARRLERDAGPYTIRLATEHTLDDDLEKFFAMHRSASGPKGHFMYEGMATFFGSFAWMLFSQGWLRLALLEVGDEPWAGVFAFAFGGEWGVWNSAYDHSKRELSPGMVLMGDCIRFAAEEGSHTFDLLRGTEAYKYRFGAVDVPLVKLTIERS